MNKKQIAKLKPLIKEKAVREYFVEKMRVNLVKDRKTKQTKTKMHNAIKKRHVLFINKINKLNDAIFCSTPPGTHYNQLKFKITD